VTLSPQRDFLSGAYRYRSRRRAILEGARKNQIVKSWAWHQVFEAGRREIESPAARHLQVVMSCFGFKASGPNYR